MNIQDTLKYLKIIRKWWWVIVLLVGATVGTMAAIALLTEKQYEATVTVQVSAPPPQEVPLYSDFGRAALRDEIEQTRSSFSEFVLEGDVPYRALETLPDIKMAGGELRDKITVDIPASSQLMRISVRASDPETAALLAKAVVEVGLEQYGQLLAQPTANTSRFIEGELEVARLDLRSAESELTQFQIINKVGNLNNAIDNQHSLIRSLTLQRDLAWADGETLRAQSLDEVIAEREVGLQSMIGLSAEYNDLRDQVERLRSTYNFLLDRKIEAQIKENQILEIGSIQIITPARIPKSPVAAISSKLIVLGAIASLLTGVLLTFLLEYLEISGAFRGFQKLSNRRDDVVALSSHTRS